MKQTARNFVHMLAAFAAFKMPGRELTLDNPDAVKVPFGVAVAFAMILFTVSKSGCGANEIHCGGNDVSPGQEVASEKAARCDLVGDRRLMIPLLRAALAIDIELSTLPPVKPKRQTPALCAAKAFVTSGFTSGQLGDPSSGGNQTFVCNGSTGFSDLQAQAAARQNLIAGTPPTTISTSCVLHITRGPLDQRHCDEARFTHVLCPHLGGWSEHGNCHGHGRGI